MSVTVDGLMSRVGLLRASPLSNSRMHWGLRWTGQPEATGAPSRSAGFGEDLVVCVVGILAGLAASAPGGNGGAGETHGEVTAANGTGEAGVRPGLEHPVPSATRPAFGHAAPAEMNFTPMV
jgi:hypothetical protein